LSLDFEKLYGDYRFVYKHPISSLPPPPHSADELVFDEAFKNSWAGEKKTKKEFKRWFDTYYIKLLIRTLRKNSSGK